MRKNGLDRGPKPLFITASILTLGLGIAFVMFPKPMLVSWQTSPDDLSIYMAQRYGVMFFGYAPILWLVRNIPSSPTRSAILVGLLIAATSMTMLSTLGVVSGVVGVPSAAAIVVEGLLAISTFYFVTIDLLRRKRA